jgi:hypothetical protein
MLRADRFPMTTVGQDGAVWMPAPGNGCREQALRPAGMTDAEKGERGIRGCLSAKGLQLVASFAV